MSNKKREGIGVDSYALSLFLCKIILTLLLNSAKIFYAVHSTNGYNHFLRPLYQGHTKWKNFVAGVDWMESWGVDQRR